MERVYCQCNQCGNRLAEFLNEWTRVGNAYCAPSYDSYGSTNLVQQGGIEDGVAQTLYENCEMHDVACSICEQNVGIQLDSAPDGHIFDEDQLVLRLRHVHLVSRSRGEKVEFNCTKFVELKMAQCENHIPAPDFVDGADAEGLRAEIESIRQAINKVFSVGHQIVPALDGNLARLEERVFKLEASVRDVNSTLTEQTVLRIEMEAQLKSLSEAHSAELQTLSREVQATLTELRVEMEAGRRTSSQKHWEDTYTGHGQLDKSTAPISPLVQAPDSSFDIFHFPMPATHGNPRSSAFASKVPLHASPASQRVNSLEPRTPAVRSQRSSSWNDVARLFPANRERLAASDAGGYSPPQISLEEVVEVAVRPQSQLVEEAEPLRLQTHTKIQLEEERQEEKRLDKFAAQSRPGGRPEGSTRKPQQTFADRARRLPGLSRSKKAHARKARGHPKTPIFKQTHQRLKASSKLEQAEPSHTIPARKLSPINSASPTAMAQTLREHKKSGITAWEAVVKAYPWVMTIFPNSVPYHIPAIAWLAELPAIDGALEFSSWTQSGNRLGFLLSQITYRQFANLKAALAQASGVTR